MNFGRDGILCEHFEGNLLRWIGGVAGRADGGREGNQVRRVKKQKRRTRRNEGNLGLREGVWGARHWDRGQAYGE